MKFRHYLASKLSLVAVLISAICPNVLAQNSPLPINVTSGHVTPINLTGYTGEAASVLKYDLEVAGFKVNSNDPPEYTLAGKNDEQLEGRLFDAGRTMKFGKAYTTGSMRARAHALANDVIYEITHVKGICLTKIAFRLEVEGRSEIAIADYDGHDVKYVTSDAALVQSPAWVPGQFKLAYTSYKSGFPNIYLHDLASGQRTVIANYPGSCLSPAVSHNGKRVAMILTRSGQVDLYVSDIDGSHLTQLTRSRDDESSPCWSPDDSKICFTGRYGGRAALFTIPAEGGELHRIETVGVLNNTEPDWSPDGKSIAFTSLGGGFRICTVPSGGGEATILTGGQDPSWAPNSRTIIFTRQQSDFRHLYLLDVPTKSVKDVHQVSGISSQPAWAH